MIRPVIFLVALGFSQSPAISQAVESQDSGQARAQATLQNMGIPFSDEAFLRYAQGGDASVVSLFLSAGININSKNSKGETALVLASREGHIALAESLLKAGADPTLLIGAAKVQKVDWKDLLQAISQLSGVLLAILGGVFAHLYNQRTKKLSELETIEKMLPHLGADPKQRQAASLVAIAHLATPELAARFVAVYPGMGSTLACLELLRSKSLKDKQILYEALPQLLISAASDGDEEVVDLLLNRFGKSETQVLPMDKPDQEGRTALMWAARNGHVGIMKLLVANGVDITKADKGGETALHLAAKHAMIEATKFLVAEERFQDPKKRIEFIRCNDNKGRSALDRAREEKNKDLCALLDTIGGANNTNQKGF